MQEILKIQNITIAIAGKVPQVCSSINSINKEISNAKAFSAGRHKVPVYSLEEDIEIKTWIPKSPTLGETDNFCYQQCLIIPKMLFTLSGGKDKEVLPSVYSLQISLYLCESSP